MATFYEFFNEQKYADAVKNFLDLISSSGRRDPKSIEQPILLKEGFMIKRAQGRKRFGMKNFKKRWFRLTNHEFTYRKCKGDQPLYSIPIENILAVEKLEEESFKMKNMFQVIQPERALYIQANNCVEAKDWIDVLTKVSQCNQRRLTFYHPSAHLNGHWLCCRATSDTAPGCSPCTGGLPANIQLDIDGDRETERIYSLFISYMGRLEKMQGSTPLETRASRATSASSLRPPLTPCSLQGWDGTRAACACRATACGKGGGHAHHCPEPSCSGHEAAHLAPLRCTSDHPSRTQGYLFPCSPRSPGHPVTRWMTSTTALPSRAWELCTSCTTCASVSRALCPAGFHGLCLGWTLCFVLLETTAVFPGACRRGSRGGQGSGTLFSLAVGSAPG
uniref:PH domain-containing protein n=1 Tax=Oryctolagus cuniculus TaxID=9986 RepID=G1TG13_RABIT